MAGTVLHLVSRLNVGGPARHLIDLVPALAPLGWEATIACGPAEPSEGDLLAAARDRALGVHELQRMRRAPGLGDLAAIAHVGALLRELRPTVLHTHTAKAGVIGRVAAVVCGRRPPVVVHTFHGHVLDGYWPRPVSRTLAMVERGGARLCDRLVAVSPAIAQSLVAHRVAPAEHIAVLPVAIDAGRLTCPERVQARSQLGLAGTAQVLAYVGRLAPIKRVDRLMEAVAGARTPGLTLLIAGSGPSEAQLRQHHAARALGERVRWLGRIQDVGTVYAAADAVALASDNEGTPLSLLEAALCRRPAVATDVGGVRDVVVHGETGLLTAPDAMSLAAAIDRILALDTGVRAQWARHACELARAGHEPAHVAQLHADFYAELSAISAARRG